MISFRLLLRIICLDFTWLLAGFRNSSLEMEFMFIINIDLKPNAQVKYRQPYHLSKFDATRLAYLYEEAEAEGKVHGMSPDEVRMVGGVLV